MACNACTRLQHGVHNACRWVHVIWAARAGSHGEREREASLLSNLEQSAQDPLVLIHLPCSVGIVNQGP